jgi:hypothetical protein
MTSPENNHGKNRENRPNFGSAQDILDLYKNEDLKPQIIRIVWAGSTFGTFSWIELQTEEGQARLESVRQEATASLGARANELGVTFSNFRSGRYEQE